MHWTKPGDLDYDERRALFNAMVDKRPRLIAACENPGDVAQALERARADHLDVAVRAGGHSVAGMSTNDDGLVVDVRPMRNIEVDPRTRRAHVGAGVTWRELDAATQEHGLATTGGRVSSTGVAGFTLGGGSGWLERSYGLACDNLAGVDMVTADGREVHVDEEHHPELLWAMRGGGGNFGVVTALDLELHRVGPTVQAGLLAWPTTAAPEVARAYRDWAQDAPEELGSWLIMLTAPDEDWVPRELVGESISAVAMVWAGHPDDGADYVAALRALQPPLDLVEPMPYTEFQCILDDPPGNRHYWSADYHDRVTDDMLDVVVASATRTASELTQQILLPWGGQVARVPASRSPLAQRSARWVTHPFAVWEDPADDEANIAWVRRFRQDVAPYTTGGVYLNFIGAEGQDRVRDAFGPENHARLVEVKTAWDPDNVFRGNQNITPLVTA